MRCTPFLVLLCIFECADIVFAACTVSKYDEGHGDRIQCSNTSLAMVLDQTSTDVAAVMIFKSRLESIPARAFAKYAATLVSLNIHQCGITDIHQEAFDGTSRLKKLSLPNNNLTVVKERWFKDLVYLEQLDLSFNLIVRIEPTVFGTLLNLKRLDLRDNRLTCLEPIALRPMGGIDKIYFSGNPLNLRCRGKLTLWLKDHGINYKTVQTGKESWLDSLLWLCAIDDAKIAESEILMKECVILNLFNQLRTGLITAESYPLTVSQDCVYTRNLLTNCLTAEARANQAFTYGNVIKKLLLNLRDFKSTI